MSAASSTRLATQPRATSSKEILGLTYNCVEREEERGRPPVWGLLLCQEAKSKRSIVAPVFNHQSTKASFSTSFLYAFSVLYVVNSDIPLLFSQLPCTICLALAAIWSSAAPAGDST
jgi:hypothetical protein